MAQDSWPAGDHTAINIPAGEWERLVGPLIASAVYGSTADTAVVFADSTGLHVKVRAGKFGGVRGFAWSSGGSEETVAIAANSSGSDRVDAIVLRLDRGDDNHVRVVAKTGTTALTRDDIGAGSDFWELLLAWVTVPNGAANLGPTAVARKESYAPPSRLLMLAGTAGALNPDDGLPLYFTDTKRAVVGNGTGFITTKEDSGNVAILAGANFSTPSGAAVRKVNGIVYCQMAFHRLNRSLTGTGINLGSVPAGYRPDETTRFTGVQDGGHPIAGTINTAGAITLDDYSAPAAIGTDFKVGKFSWVAA